MGFTAAAAAAVGAAGMIAKGNAESASMKAQGRLQGEEAQQAHEQAQYNAMLSDMRAGQAIGRETATFGASGVELSSGSAGAILESSAASKELQRQNILHGGTVQSIDHENQASLDAFGAASAQEGGMVGGIGSILGAGAKVYGQYGNTDGLTPSQQTEWEYDQWSGEQEGRGNTNWERAQGE